MDYVLQTEALTKTYNKTNVVDKVSLTVRPGDIYGFVGKNGAGKTTFIRTVLGLTKADGGSFRFFDGQDLAAARKRTGSLIEGPSLYKNMTAKENIEMYAAMLGADKRRSQELLKTVGLADTGKKRVVNFSLGMKQRLGIAMALVGEPDFLILDEPINGLDPKGIVEMRELLLTLHRQGKTIFISSHILGELEKVATRYGIIANGHIVEEITAEELQKICIARTVIKTNDPPKAADIVKRFLQTQAVTIENDLVMVACPIENIGALTNALFSENIIVSALSNDDNSAERYFIRRMEEE